jgi:serine/threonine-protein kinase
LVLELVEGDTLADRIRKGAIPVEEALKLALQIAEALEAAHEKGVVHRDLKPANIKVTPNGKAKVLDFGLAKALAGDQSDLNLSNSPTLSEAATMQGVILGTAAYMPPEQAKGKTVDKRADIWAFGVVLFEMLSGRTLFTGETVSETLASVIKSEPEWRRLPLNLHPRIRLLLERCLEKEPKDRCSGIADARVDIQKVLDDPGGVFAQSITEAKTRKVLSLKLPWVAAIAILCILAGGMAIWQLKPIEPKQTMRFDYHLPEDQNFASLSYSALAVSPSGKQFVYSTSSGLYLRSLDELNAKLISGTEEPVEQPFFSPDGKWVGYFSIGDRKLKKISVNGGAPVSLCHVTGMFAGAWWGADDSIVFGQSPGDMMQVSSNGGDPEPFIKANYAVLIFPQLLPDKKSILYTRGPTPFKIFVQSLESGKTKELFPGRYARYFSAGYIVYGTEGDANISAIPFDLDKLEVVGASVPVVEDAIQGESSDSGTLVYIQGTQGVDPDYQRSLVWVDRKGKEESIGAPLNLYRFPSISPDGTKVAVTVVARGSRKADVWVWDLARKILTSITLGGDYNITPLWSPDGKRISFFSAHYGNDAKFTGIYWKAADGSGKPEQLYLIPEYAFGVCGWLDDGKALVGVKSLGSSMYDIEVLPLEEDNELQPLLSESYNELQPKISPDGQWIMYTSNESGRNEVYVRSLPDVNKVRRQISRDGGDSPLWSPDGRELFYRNGDKVLAASVKTDPDFSIEGMPRTLFQGKYIQALPLEGTPWDINPDGKRFLMIKPSAEIPRKINIVVNWFEELKQKVPVN